MKKQKVSVVGTVLTVEYPSINKKFVADLALYPKSIYLACDSANHGMKQKFGDAKSGEDAAEKYAEVQLIHASLLTGQWERTANIDLTPIICEAVSRLMKKPLEAVRKAAAAKPEDVKIWHAKPQVRAEILKIRSERAQAALEDAEEEELNIKL